MGKIPHGCARTTPATRLLIQQSTESLQKLAVRFGLDPKTVAKWRNRTTTQEAVRGPKPASTVLTPAEEAAIILFRQQTLLPLDDCLYALQEAIPKLSRSALHRCFQRHGISRLPPSEEVAEAKKAPFKNYPLGYLHLDFAELQTEEGKQYLFVAIDRTSKLAFAELHPQATQALAVFFLRRVLRQIPYQVHKLLPDNGVQFRNLPHHLQAGRHPVGQFCDEWGIEQRFTNFLRHIPFASAFHGDQFAQALAVVVELQTGARRKLPADAPTSFITPSWQGFVSPQREVERLPYELCVLSTLRERLRSGDVFVPGSRKFADLESYLIPLAEWPGLRPEVVQQLGLPPDPAQRLHERLAELEALLPRVTALLETGGEVRLEDGELVLQALQAEELPDSVRTLDEQIRARMPVVELTDILVEVDAWTGFSGVLRRTPARAAEAPEPVYAALLAAACNISLADMARSSGLDYQVLWWASHQ